MASYSHTHDISAKELSFYAPTVVFSMAYKWEGWGKRIKEKEADHL